MTKSEIPDFTNAETAQISQVADAEAVNQSDQGRLYLPFCLGHTYLKGAWPVNIWRNLRTYYSQDSVPLESKLNFCKAMAAKNPYEEIISSLSLSSTEYRRLSYQGFYVLSLALGDRFPQFSQLLVQYSAGESRLYSPYGKHDVLLRNIQAIPQIIDNDANLSYLLTKNSSVAQLLTHIYEGDSADEIVDMHELWGEINSKKAHQGIRDFFQGYERKKNYYLTEFSQALALNRFRKGEFLKPSQQSLDRIVIAIVTRLYKTTPKKLSQEVPAVLQNSMEDYISELIRFFRIAYVLADSEIGKFDYQKFSAVSYEQVSVFIGKNQNALPTVIRQIFFVNWKDQEGNFLDPEFHDQWTVWLKSLNENQYSKIFNSISAARRFFYNVTEQGSEYSESAPLFSWFLPHRSEINQIFSDLRSNFSVLGLSSAQPARVGKSSTVPHTEIEEVLAPVLPEDYLSETVILDMVMACGVFMDQSMLEDYLDRAVSLAEDEAVQMILHEGNKLYHPTLAKKVITEFVHRVKGVDISQQELLVSAFDNSDNPGTDLPYNDIDSFNEKNNVAPETVEDYGLQEGRTHRRKIFEFKSKPPPNLK